MKFGNIDMFRCISVDTVLGVGAPTAGRQCALLFKGERIPNRSQKMLSPAFKDYD